MSAGDMTTGEIGRSLARLERAVDKLKDRVRQLADVPAEQVEAALRAVLGSLDEEA